MPHGRRRGTWPAASACTPDYARGESRCSSLRRRPRMGGMRLLVLGGTHFVGRAVAETALARGDEVTLLNRGRSRAAAGAELIVADRTDPEALRSALGNREWDAVIDTWSGAPRVIGEACGLLAGRAGHFGYVSSRSVYRWPMPRGADEQAPVVDGDPDEDGDDDYAAAKRGG